MTGTDFDLFVSYARADLSRLTPLVGALRQEGLRVWIDHGEIPNFSALREQIERGLARSRAVLVCYSATYPMRRWCMAELAAVLTVIGQRAELRPRLLVLNLESGVEHIVPHALRDSLVPNLPEGDSVGLQRLARQVAEQLRSAEGVLGDVALAANPRWFGAPRYSSARFTGREIELWSIHEALSYVDRLGSALPASQGVCQLRGLGGLGKSLIAEEYALRFAAAWQAGIFWLEAPGNQARRTGDVSRVHAAALETALRQVVRALGGNAQGMTAADMRAHVAQYAEGQPSLGLWIVDDLPVGLTAQEMREWLSPHARLRTLVTTRSFEHGAIGRVIDLEPMDAADAATLLSLDDAGNSGSNIPSAPALAERLGWHPLALDVTRAALRSMQGLWTPEQFIERFDSDATDLLALASELSDELPNGHEKEIAATLLAGFEFLPEDSRTLLRVSALCAEAPIPTGVLLSAMPSGENALAVREVRVALACKALEGRALCSRDGEGSLLVHTLISRSVRFRESASVAYRECVGRASDYLARELAGFERYDDLPTLGKLAPHARAVLERVDERRPKLEEALGDYENTSGHFAEAARLLGGAFAAEREASGLHDPHVLDLANRCALALSFAGEPQAALEIYLEASEAYQQLGPEYEERLILLKGNAAAALRGLHRKAEAVQIEREVLQWRLERLGPEHRMTLTSMHQLSVAEDDAGNGARALELEREAYRRRERILGPNAMHTLLSLQALAQLEYRLGSAPDAARYAEENARRRVALLGPNHPYAKSGMRVYIGLTGSRKLLDEFGLSPTQVFNERDWRQDNYNSVIAIVDGRYDEALAIVDRMLASESELDPQTVLVVRHNRLAALVQIGRLEEAERFGEALTRDEEASLGPNAWLTLQSRYYLALNLPPEASYASQAAALMPVAAAMVAHLPPANVPRLRCELEWMLARSLSDASSVTATDAEQLRQLAQAAGDRVLQLTSDCAVSLVLARLARTEAVAELDAAVAALVAACGPRHPEVVRFTWLLCQLERERDNAAWQARLRSLQWLTESNAQLGRLTRRCLLEIKREA